MGCFAQQLANQHTKKLFLGGGAPPNIMYLLEFTELMSKREEKGSGDKHLGELSRALSRIQRELDEISSITMKFPRNTFPWSTLPR